MRDSASSFREAIFWNWYLENNCISDNKTADVSDGIARGVGWLSPHEQTTLIRQSKSESRRHRCAEYGSGFVIKTGHGFLICLSWASDGRRFTWRSLNFSLKCLSKNAGGRVLIDKFLPWNGSRFNRAEFQENWGISDDGSCYCDLVHDVFDILGLERVDPSMRNVAWLKM